MFSCESPERLNVFPAIFVSLEYTLNLWFYTTHWQWVASVHWENVMKVSRDLLGTHTQKSLAEEKAKKLQHQIAKLTEDERRVRGHWTRWYHRYLRAVKEMDTILSRILAGKKPTKLQLNGLQRNQEILKMWPKRSEELTAQRDVLRAYIHATEEDLQQVRTELAVILTEQSAHARATDEIVDQVFLLNSAMVDAMHRRDDFLKEKIFPQLFYGDNKLHRQITFTSSDGLRRVVALVNSMTIVDTRLAEEAREEIRLFFGRFEPQAVVPSVRPLYEITEKLLYQKTSFKVGPELYRFISMDLDVTLFPELVRAQNLLKQSIRSEKTNSYVRLWKRTSKTDHWKPLAQS